MNIYKIHLTRNIPYVPRPMLTNGEAVIAYALILFKLYLKILAYSSSPETSNIMSLDTMMRIDGHKAKFCKFHFTLLALHTQI